MIYQHLLWLVLASGADPENSTQAGRFVVEHPTLLNLGFEWEIRMLRAATFFLVLAGWACSARSADQLKHIVRPISSAESVLAVYHESDALGSSVEPPIILVAWPDGHIVWSINRLNGGAPYRTGQIDPKRITSLLARFENDGLFADENLTQAHFGPDSAFTTILIRSGRNHVQMQSWHELFEGSGKLVADHRGVRSLEGRPRLQVLRQSPAEYLFFRFVWSETRARLTDLIPDESKPSSGKPVLQGPVLVWQE
jgi:hypothetical protein